MIEAFLLFVRERIPGRGFRPSWAERPSGVNQSHFDLPAVTLFAQPVPTAFVFAAIPGNQLLRRHQWKMRRVVRKVKEERLAGFLRFVDELQSEIRPQKSCVPVLPQDGRVARDRSAVKIKRFLPPSG